MISNSSEDFNWYLSISKSRDSHNPSPELLSDPNTGKANGLTSILLLIVRLLFFWLVIIIKTNSSWTELISFSCFKTQLLSGLCSNKVLWTKGPWHENATQTKVKVQSFQNLTSKLVWLFRFNSRESDRAIVSLHAIHSSTVYVYWNHWSFIVVLL